MSKQYGSVRWFKDQYGFVSPDGTTKDVFIHISELQRSNVNSLKAGDRIEFMLRPAKKGEEAFDIRIV